MKAIANLDFNLTTVYELSLKEKKRFNSAQKFTNAKSIGYRTFFLNIEKNIFPNVINLLKTSHSVAQARC
jgi:hypothetical protein